MLMEKSAESVVDEERKETHGRGHGNEILRILQNIQTTNRSSSGIQGFVRERLCADTTPSDEEQEQHGSSSFDEPSLTTATTAEGLERDGRCGMAEISSITDSTETPEVTTAAKSLQPIWRSRIKDSTDASGVVEKTAVLFNTVLECGKGSVYFPDKKRDGKGASLGRRICEIPFIKQVQRMQRCASFESHTTSTTCSASQESVPTARNTDSVAFPSTSSTFSKSTHPPRPNQKVSFHHPLVSSLKRIPRLDPSEVPHLFYSDVELSKSRQSDRAESSKQWKDVDCHSTRLKDKDSIQPPTTSRDCNASPAENDQSTGETLRPTMPDIPVETKVWATRADASVRNKVLSRCRRWFANSKKGSESILAELSHMEEELFPQGQPSHTSIRTHYNVSIRTEKGEIES